MPQQCPGGECRVEQRPSSPSERPLRSSPSPFRRSFSTMWLQKLDSNTLVPSLAIGSSKNSSNSYSRYSPPNFFLITLSFLLFVLFRLFLVLNYSHFPLNINFSLKSILNDTIGWGVESGVRFLTSRRPLPRHHRALLFDLWRRPFHYPRPFRT